MDEAEKYTVNENQDIQFTLYVVNFFPKSTILDKSNDIVILNIISFIVIKWEIIAVRTLFLIKCSCYRISCNSWELFV